MKHELIKTDDYLLVVNDEDIKEGDFQINHLTNKVSKRTDNWLQASKENCSKILAHLPLNGTQYLEGVDLLPPISKEEDIEKLASEYSVSELSIYPETSSELSESEVHRIKAIVEAHSYRGFKKGYNKAKETYKYTEEDMIEFAVWRSITDFDEPHTPLAEFKIWESLNQPKLPVAFVCETIHEYVNTGWAENTFLKPKTITNSDGRTEWVGEYLF